jgi:hypothetical protein
MQSIFNKSELMSPFHGGIINTLLTQSSELHLGFHFRRDVLENVFIKHVIMMFQKTGKLLIYFSALSSSNLSPLAESCQKNLFFYI